MSLLNPYQWSTGWGAGMASFGASDDVPQYAAPLVNHVVAGRRRLIAQYQGKPNITAIVETIAGRFQAIEDICSLILQSRGLDTGFGVLLDHVGERAGLERGGLADNTYRVRLAGQIVANASDTTPEQVRAILDVLMQGLYDVVLVRAPPGCTILRTAQLFQEDGDAYAKIVNKGVAIGTRCIVEWELPSEMGMTFGFEDDNTAGPWAEFAEDSSDAGLWAEGSIGE